LKDPVAIPRNPPVVSAACAKAAKELEGGGPGAGLGLEIGAAPAAKPVPKILFICEGAAGVTDPPNPTGAGVAAALPNA